jgi:hypothetical protein
VPVTANGLTRPTAYTSAARMIPNLLLSRLVFRFVAPILGVFAFAQMASADGLWQSTTYGMSVDDVLKAVPGAARRSLREGERLADGAEDLVEAPLVIIDNHQFLPQFYFKEEKLEQVTLSLRNQVSAYEANLVFQELVDTLRVKYGHEISSGPNGIGADARFQFGKTNIVVALITIGAPLLNVVYQERVASDASKL